MRWSKCRVDDEEEEEDLEDLASGCSWKLEMWAGFSVWEGIEEIWKDRHGFLRIFLRFFFCLDSGELRGFGGSENWGC